jgi:hypothetical protein
LPHLTGVTGIVYTINQGDAVNILVQRDDVAAQTALAALIGGDEDGIREAHISDGRLSIAEAEARGDAELSLSKDPITTVTYETRDPSHNVGADVTFATSFPAISGTFKIQSVGFSQIGISGPTGRVFPLRSVTASSRRFSFEDLLRQMRSR